MGGFQLPPLALADWQGTRNTLQRYARLVGGIRAALAPRQKHWWHVALHVAATGLTTTPVPAGDRQVELLLDLVRHRLAITTSLGDEVHVPLVAQGARRFLAETTTALDSLGIAVPVDAGLFAGEAPTPYDPQAVMRYWQALAWIDAVFKRFRGRLREETGPVLLFPHHFDLSMTWFSGRRVPGADPADEETADEQMSFGFVTGDSGISEPYFYATAYPVPDGWTDLELPAGAWWHTQAWTGVVLGYADLVAAADPEARLSDYLQTLQRHGAALMAAQGQATRSWSVTPQSPTDAPSPPPPLTKR